MADLFSPAAAFAAQARTEAVLHAAVGRVMRTFLAGVEANATDLYTLTPAGVSGSWAALCDEMLATLVDRGKLSQDGADYVARGLAESDLPNEAYDSARAVLMAAAAADWSVEYREGQMRLALSMDTPEVTLTAAVKRKPVPEIAAILSEGGARWSSHLDALVQTAATGLHGMERQRDLLAAGIGEKRWVSRHDAKVRLTHAVADGQVVPTNQPYSVGSAMLMWPGEYGGPAGEVINCRCVSVGVRDQADPLFLTGDEFS